MLSKNSKMYLTGKLLQTKTNTVRSIANKVSMPECDFKPEPYKVIQSIRNK